ncbi:TonB family protein [Sorangium sp. So ce887]|uniref:TonB family protein n=1 Tax=Sorangium sp. So ce887 TaxID=3133324 RepID=UPI003F5ED0BE
MMTSARMDRPTGVRATLLLLPLLVMTACEATTASIPGAAQLDAAREPPSGSAVWACPYPDEADKNAIDRGTAVIKVYVEPDGSARWAVVLHDSGYGFGAAAAQCAVRRRYVPAKDRSGAPFGSWTLPITVTFTREPP